MNEITLQLDERTISGKKTSDLRADGFIPSVVYGAQDKPIMTQSSAVETLKAIKAVGKHTPLNIMVDGKKKLAIVKNVDIDPIRHHLRNIEFHTIKQDDIITTDIPVRLIGLGESLAERAGLVILQAIETIEIKAKPADLPDSVELSVLELATDEDKLTIADIKLPQGVEFADAEQDMELVIANVYETSALQAANEAAGGDAEAETIEEESEAGAEGVESSSETATSEAEKSE